MLIGSLRIYTRLVQWIISMTEYCTISSFKRFLLFLWWRINTHPFNLILWITSRIFIFGIIDLCTHTNWLFHLLCYIIAVQSFELTLYFVCKCLIRFRFCKHFVYFYYFIFDIVLYWIKLLFQTEKLIKIIYHLLRLAILIERI